MKTFVKPSSRTIKVAKCESAKVAIGTLVQNQDVFILTYGQFSLADAIVAILEQTGPADVALSTWTAADAHLERVKTLLDTDMIKSFRMVVDRSFESRQPEYCHHMRQLFGLNCIRAIRTHAKFLVISNDQWKVAVRTSMNLNENPRLENIEISTDTTLADFFTQIVDDVFREVQPGENRSHSLELENIQSTMPFAEVAGEKIPTRSLHEPSYSHTIKNN